MKLIPMPSWSWHTSLQHGWVYPSSSIVKVTHWWKLCWPFTNVCSKSTPLHTYITTPNLLHAGSLCLSLLKLPVKILSVTHFWMTCETASNLFCWPSFFCVLVGWFVSLFIQGKPLASGYYSRHPETIQYNKDTKRKMRGKRYKGRRKFSI